MYKGESILFVILSRPETTYGKCSVAVYNEFRLYKYFCWRKCLLFHKQDRRVRSVEYMDG